VARGTQEPLVLARVDADVALAGLASGRACQTGAECCRGVHACPPCLALTYAKRSMAGSLFLSQPIRTTVKCRATETSRMKKNPVDTDDYPPLELLLSQYDPAHFYI